MTMNAFTCGLRLAPEGLGLAALADSGLERRFYSWLGCSGTRYVCTVFRTGEEESISSFTDAAVIGVAHRDGVRRPICVLAPAELETNSNVRAKAAAALGVNEWHVIFSTRHSDLAEELCC